MQAGALSHKLYYLQQNKPLAKRPARFDVVSVDSQDTMDWIKNAFEV